MKPKNVKVGRHRKPYLTSWGVHINGLRKRGDGRWLIVDTGKTYVEPDERRAVARFRRWEAEKQGESILDLVVSFDAFESTAGVREAFESGASIRGDLNGNRGVGLDVPEVVLWAYVREQLISRPEYVADQVGIPEVARLADLPKLEASPTLKAIGQLHFDKCDSKRKQRRQMQLFWAEFMSWMGSHGVTTLRQLTPALVAEFSDHAKAQSKSKAIGRDGSPKYLRHRFTSIRGIVNYARKRGVHAADVRHARDCCAVLENPKRTVTKNPHPISREDFHRLLDGAPNPRMRAILLTMLNCCMKPGGALALDWGEINFEKRTVVTDRHKTSVVRIAMLWPRTIEALRAIRPAQPSSDAPVFVSQFGKR